MKFSSRRSVVYSSNGIVSSSQPLASQCGLEILRRGGNAADAAIATAAALNVTEPTSCGIGGDCFVLYYDAEKKQVAGLNGSGKSPKALSLEKIRQLGIEDETIPLTNLNAVTVPGAVDAFIQTFERFGSKNVSLDDIFSPAIRLAEQGYPVSEITAFHWKKSESLIQNASPNGNEMLRNGFAPEQGQIMTMKYLAETFRTIVKCGRDGFYRGRIAQSIVDLIQSQGGLMTLEDLDEHRSMLVQPIHLSYPNPLNSNEFYHLWECPPNGQGLVALIALGLIKQLEEQKIIRPLSTYEQNSAEYLHILIEVLRLAFADGRYFIADPDLQSIPIEQLLSSEYLRTRIRDFHPSQIQSNLHHGSPINSSDTVYFAVTDDKGNACSFIYSNYAGFGTGAVPKHCGFTLQNRGSGFVLKENHPNCLQGGKRPYHTIIPSMITKDHGELVACFGVMGGFMQPQGHLQVFCNLIHHQMNVQQALDAPRFCIGPGMPTETDQGANKPSEVLVEEGISVETVEKLRSFGHRIQLITGPQRALFGRGQIIRKVVNDDNRLVWAAGSDPRADGQAVGW